ncbi:MAG: stage II sporulation protein R [Anaerovoracaceae bacterium]|jgi:stage II sporulation protein R
MKLKKKQMGLLFLMLLSLFVYTTWSVYSSEYLLSNEDFLRFHVIANSDTNMDQALKLKVRDGLLDIINKDLATETMVASELTQKETSLDIEKTKEYIENNLVKIEKTAERIIVEEGYDYPVKAKLGETWIPKKTYGNITFPAGNYQALNVVIGEGGGQNWWCVLFPPLCLIGLEDPEKEELYKESVLDEKYKVLLESKEPKTLKLKFKTLDLIKKQRKSTGKE